MPAQASLFDRREENPPFQEAIDFYRHDDQQQQTKREFLAEWVRAVNGHGGFGVWAADVSRHPKDVEEILKVHGI
ncbi:MAG TPA: hypothetical protein VFQ43_03545 [Nitrososphaera sp.]|nr:hypothetical protein [Nitrososphaera sp.]